MGVVPPYLLFGWWIFLIERRSMIKDRETLIIYYALLKLRMLETPP